MKSIIVKKMKMSCEAQTTLMQIINEYDFTLEKGEGMRIIEQSSDYILCHYLFEKVYNQDSYNYDTNELEKVTVKRVDVVPFFLDFHMKTLDVLGSKQSAVKVIECLGKISRYSIPISDIHINLLNLLDKCESSGITFFISRVKMTDYVFFDSIIGDCVLNLIDYPKPIELLKKFESKIVNVSLNITTNDSYSITFYKSGVISIYKDVDDINIDFLRFIKQGV